MQQSAQSQEGTRLEIDTLTTQEAFAALEREWNALADACSSRSVFLAYDWFRAAWAWRNRDAALFIVTVRRQQELVGLLPLIRLRSDRTGVRQLALLTVPDTQVCDALVLPDLASAVCEALATTLARRSDWDVLQLDYLAIDGVLTTTLVPQLARLQLQGVTQDAGRNAFVATTGTWTEYYAGRSRSLKKANNLAANRLASAGTIKVEHLARGERNDAAYQHMMTAVIDISRRSWKQATGNSLDHAGPGNFISTLSAAAYARGWLSLWLLYLDERPMAMEYQLVFDGNVHALRADFDAECTEISPGSYLFRHLLERIFGMNCVRYYMGPGDNPYKARWTDQGDPLCKVTISNRTVRGRLFRQWEHAVKPWLRTVRDRAAARRTPAGSAMDHD